MPTGEPREQYSRRYNVIPPDATEREALAIFLEGWRRSKETAGGSYDDAGIGNLTDKTACLYNIPSEDRDQYLDFFSEHYPTTSVLFQDVDPDFLDEAEELLPTLDEPLPPMPDGFAVHATTIVQPFPFPTEGDSP